MTRKTGRRRRLEAEGFRVKKDAEIQIVGRQRYEDGQEDGTEQLFRGRFYRREGRFYLHYREPGPEGETSVALWAEPGRACVLRGGAFPSRLDFCPGQVLPASYRTPFGALALETAARSLKLGLTDQGGELEICYDLLSGGRPFSQNWLKVRARPL